MNWLLEPHLSEVEQRFSVTFVAQICKGCVARFLLPDVRKSSSPDAPT